MHWNVEWKITNKTTKEHTIWVCVCIYTCVYIYIYIFEWIFISWRNKYFLSEWMIPTLSKQNPNSSEWHSRPFTNWPLTSTLVSLPSLTFIFSTPKPSPSLCWIGLPNLPHISSHWNPTHPSRLSLLLLLHQSFHYSPS